MSMKLVKAFKRASMGLMGVVLCGAAGCASVKQDTLDFHNLHTGDKVKIPYKAGPFANNNASMDKLSHLMRDHYSNGAQREIDPELLEILYHLKQALEARHPGRSVRFEVVSGYRSPDTNEKMRKRGGGQADDSRHTHGQAIDIRAPGFTTAQVRDAAFSLQRGGVGYYPGSGFVHVDTGYPGIGTQVHVDGKQRWVRYWGGNWNPYVMPSGPLVALSY